MSDERSLSIAKRLIGGRPGAFAFEGHSVPFPDLGRSETASAPKGAAAGVGVADENGRRSAGATRRLPTESSQSVAGPTVRLSSWLRVGASIGELVGRRSARRILTHERYSRGVIPFSCRKFRLKFEMF